jgi:hypothetical protein
MEWMHAEWMHMEQSHLRTRAVATSACIGRGFSQPFDDFY